MESQTATPTPRTATAPASARPRHAFRRHSRLRVFGLTWDDAVKYFFGGNALVSVIVLALITYFLFREGAGFFGQNLDNLRIYRRAGLEYVDIIRGQESEHVALTRYLNDVRLRQRRALMEGEGLSAEQANAALAGFDEFSAQFADAAEPLRAIVSDLGDLAIAIKTKFIVAADKREERRQLQRVGRSDDANLVQIDAVDFAAELRPLLATRPLYEQANQEFAARINAALAAAPTLPTPEVQARLVRFKQLVQQYIASFPAIDQRLAEWNYAAPVPRWRALTTFIFGADWLTASFWQDWYGVIPLFLGSLLVSIVALVIAVPLGVAAAIYVNQVATPREQKFIKPCIEFISAFPSVVLGFFGIAVLGETLRHLSQAEWARWIPGFPIAERLNALTAGCLLALIAVPTIFTLAEDALNNVPRALREASFALGATRLQTVLQIILPAALSGIVSAVLLGFGRVIGETMVVLLCAGNRIAIPDFTAGLAAFTQPVHTMTGIIAQEMGEVVRGEIHYRALFVVGIVLFFLALAINYFAQKIVRQYRLPGT